MKKQKYYWIVYKPLSKKDKVEFIRQHFWGWMMDHFPRIYRWCNKHLPFDTLPFQSQKVYNICDKEDLIWKRRLLI